MIGLTTYGHTWLDKSDEVTSNLRNNNYTYSSYYYFTNQTAAIIIKT